MSGTLNEQLQQIADTKDAIAQALNNKGVEVTPEDSFASYALKIDEIQGGSGETVTVQGGFNLFDTKLADHILEGNEALGWALQGTSVYKTDYPDFYDKCLQEYTESVNVKHANITKVGNITEDDCVLKGFSTGNYAEIPTKINLGNNFEILVKVTTPQDWSTNQTVLCGSGTELFAMACIDTSNPNNFSYNIGDGSAWLCDSTNNNGNTTLEPNTVYYVKMTLSDNVYTAFISTDGNDWIQDWTLNSTTIIPQMDMVIGVGRTQTTSFFEGSLDISEWYIKVNGEYVWQNSEYNKHANGHMFYPISNKSVIDTIFNTTGSAWMYGIDEENECIFLPRNNFFEQATGDISEVGSSVEAGLPNITGKVNFGSGGASSRQSVVRFSSGAFNGETSCPYSPPLGNQVSNVYENLVFDASGSNPIYGNSDSVQPNAVKKLLYICVGNTVVDESTIDLTKEIELNTPFFLGQSQYFENEPNNLSWLKSTGEFHSKELYPSMYEYILQNIQAATKDFANINSEYDDYCYVLDEENETFRLPLLNGSEKKFSDKRYIDLDFTSKDITVIAPANGWYYCNCIAGTTSAHLSIARNTNGSFASQPSYRLNGAASAGTAIFTSLDVNRGEEVRIYGTATGEVRQCRFYYNIGNGSLYYFVGEAVNNANLIDLGRISTAMATKLTRESDALDGQWVYSLLYIASGQSCPTTTQTYDLSSYLPVDEYDYEILFDVMGNTGSSSGNSSVVALSSDLIPQAFNVCRAITRTSSSMIFANCGTIIIGKQRILNVVASAGNTGNFNLYARAYRRLGRKENN